MAFEKTANREGASMKRRPMRRRKKVCVFCGKDNVIDYKDTNKLKRYINKLNNNKQIPPVKMAFYDNKLAITKNLEGYIAGLRTGKFVQKIVYNKYVKNAIKFVLV